MKPKIVCFVGDVHAGSKAAVADEIELADGDIYTPSLHQEWLLERWIEFYATAKKLSKGHDFHLMLGGDLIDGCQHHGSTQTFGTEDDQIGLSVSLLTPLAEMSVRSFAILGTPAHAGKVGQFDKRVAKDLEVAPADIDWQHRISFEERILDWAHTTSMGRRPHTRGNNLNNLINDIHVTCLESHDPDPDLIVRHHVHQFDDRMDGRRRMRAIACPGWQLATEYTHNLPNSTLPDVGGVFWWPKENKVEVVRYEVKQSPIKVV